MMKSQPSRRTIWRAKTAKRLAKVEEGGRGERERQNQRLRGQTLLETGRKTENKESKRRTAKSEIET